jgi:hypothetical protein
MAESAALLLVVLSSGFAYSSIAWPSRFYTIREDGHRLYFRTVIYAAFILLATLLIFVKLAVEQNMVLPIGSLPDLSGELLRGSWGNLIQFSTIPVSLVLAAVVNLVVSVPILKKKLLASAVNGRDFERLVLRSLTKAIPLIITMNDKKVYVGWAVASPDPSVERMHLRILPLISGYREATTHEVIFTTFYDDIIEQIGNDSNDKLSYAELDDIEIVIPIGSIVSAHLYDLAIGEHFAEKAEADAEA